MKSVKPQLRFRGGSRVSQSPRTHAQSTASNLDLPVSPQHLDRVSSTNPGPSASDTILSARKHETEDLQRIENPIQGLGDMIRQGQNSSFVKRGSKPSLEELEKQWKRERKCCAPLKPNIKPNNRIGGAQEREDSLTRQMREIHNDTRKSSRIIRDSRARLLEIQKKAVLTEADIRELGERNELLLREMDRFHRLTKTVQRMVGTEVSAIKRSKECKDEISPDYAGCSIYEPHIYHEMKMEHPTVIISGHQASALRHPDSDNRSKSEIDLTRKLTESYDMQEKLVADNAELEVKRYILYKELMTKDQNLETCRAQVKRLQGELKLVSKENSSLHEKLNKNHPQGDAAAINKDCLCQKEDYFCSQEKSRKPAVTEELIAKLENYKSSSVELEKQLKGLEFEARTIRIEMDAVKEAATKMGESTCRAGKQGTNTCFNQQAAGPPVPPLSRACGVCPPCPAPCNPNGPPTPAEREVARLSLQLRQTEENFKTKVTECALLRAEVLKKKEELEKERCAHREVQNKLRELEMKFEGLAAHTNMMLGTKEQAFENEMNVSALKRCYREAREEIDELRTLLKEQNDQLQDYRVKYMQAQQLVEEQRRQMDIMDMDNTRISEQINLEIQRVKLKFQEKLQELAPIPELLKATQIRLKDAQQAQALAEHNAEQLARELNSAREKVHFLLHNSTKPPEKNVDKGADDKQMSMLQQRITQLTEINMSLKTEIERLKSNVIRMEESVLMNEKRLQEKMQECAQLGGEMDRCREEAARALCRANERVDTVRKCLQTTIAELEKQLASARAQISNSEKEKSEVQARMQCQIKRLNENLEQAQLRIMGLTTQVSTLRRTVSDTGDGADNQECACKSMFDNS